MDNSKELAIKKKVEKEYSTFSDAVLGLDREKLEKNMMIYAKHREESAMAKIKDPDLNDAKEIVKDLAGPYNDAEKALKLKMAYLNILIDEKKVD